jgi:uncharacterized protein
VPGGLCVHSETCGTAFALEHNIHGYPCDHFVEPDYLLGNNEKTNLLELVAFPQQVAFGRDKRDRLAAWAVWHCTWGSLGHGGLPKDQFTPTGDGEPGPRYLRPSHLEFFHPVDRPMQLWPHGCVPGVTPTRS